MTARQTHVFLAAFRCVCDALFIGNRPPVSSVLPGPQHRWRAGLGMAAHGTETERSVKFVQYRELVERFGRSAAEDIAAEAIKQERTMELSGVTFFGFLERELSRALPLVESVEEAP